MSSQELGALSLCTGLMIVHTVPVQSESARASPKIILKAENF